MNKEELSNLASGTILYIQNDGKFLARNACKFVRIDEAANDMSKVIVNGKVYSISNRRLTRDVWVTFDREVAKDDE